MDVFQALVLAIIQGITEFLPVSSSAHLILVPELLGWSANGLAFDVAVHVGTLFAVVTFLRKELIAMAHGWFTGWSSLSWNSDGLMAWMLVVATIPVGIIGLLFGGFIESHLRTALIIGVTTLVFGLLLGWVDRGGDKKVNEMSAMTFRDAILVGLAQTLALVPGTSRSGITMTALLGLGYTRVASAKFSFLLAVPAIALPGLLKTNELMSSASTIVLIPLLLGVAVSALVAFMSMHWFIALVTRVGMRPFVIYRVLLAGFIFALFL